MREWTWVLVAALLAGCAGDDPTPAPWQRTSERVVPPQAAWTWQTLASGVLALDPDSPSQTLDLVVPNGTTKALVNLTVVDGVSEGLSLSGPSSCQHAFAGPLRADGTTWTVDCGGVVPGTQTLTLTHQAGLVSIDVAVVAMVCVPYATCPTVPADT